MLEIKQVDKDGETFLFPQSSPCETFGEGRDFDTALQDMLSNAKMMRSQWATLVDQLEKGNGEGFTIEYHNLDSETEGEE